MKEQIISKDIIQLAAYNGISKSTLYNRVRSRDWDQHDAATVPTMTKAQRFKNPNGRKKQALY